MRRSTRADSARPSVKSHFDIPSSKSLLPNDCLADNLNRLTRNSPANVANDLSRILFKAYEYTYQGNRVPAYISPAVAAIEA